MSETAVQYWTRRGKELADADILAAAEAALPWVELTKGTSERADFHAVDHALRGFLKQLATYAEPMEKYVIDAAHEYMETAARAVPHGSFLLAYKLACPADINERQERREPWSAYKGGVYELAAMRSDSMPLPLVRPYYDQGKEALPNKERMLMLNYFDVASAAVMALNEVGTCDPRRDFWVWHAIPHVRELVSSGIWYTVEHMDSTKPTTKRRSRKAAGKGVAA